MGNIRRIIQTLKKKNAGEEWRVLPSLTSSGGAWVKGYPFTGNSVIRIRGRLIDPPNGVSKSIFGGGFLDNSDSRNHQLTVGLSSDNALGLTLFVSKDSTETQINSNVSDSPVTSVIEVYENLEGTTSFLLNKIKAGDTPNTTAHYVGADTALFGSLYEYVSGDVAIADPSNFELRTYEVWEDNTFMVKLADYEPRYHIPTNTYGMYDKVTDTFHTNLGEGYFYETVIQDNIKVEGALYDANRTYYSTTFDTRDEYYTWLNTNSNNIYTMRLSSKLPIFNDIQNIAGNWDANNNVINLDIFDLNTSKVDYFTFSDSKLTCIDFSRNNFESLSKIEFFNNNSHARSINFINNTSNIYQPAPAVYSNSDILYLTAYTFPSTESSTGISNLNNFMVGTEHIKWIDLSLVTLSPSASVSGFLRYANSDIVVYVKDEDHRHRWFSRAEATEITGITIDNFVAGKPPQHLIDSL